VYLPRIHALGASRAVRVGPTPPSRRGPIPGLEEVEAPYGEILDRAPRFVVVNECWVWRYLPDAFVQTPEGRIRPTTQLAEAKDADATSFYEALFGGLLPYRLAQEARMEHPLFRARKLHASVSCPVYTFERVDAREGEGVGLP